MNDTDFQDLLCSITGPEDLRKLPIDSLPALADQIRRAIIETLSQTGGHLASSLGAVEIAIALHYVFNTPHDRICWDVGHQAYAHKMLTGRREQFLTLRCHKGLSGFPKREESDYDVFSVGHAGTSISSALGIAEAFRLAGSDRKVIAVIGDGSLTSGLAMEGLNQAGTLKDRNLIVVLNDNEYSISMNVGAISAFLSRKMAGTTARAIRRRLKEFLTAIPSVGGKMFHIAKRSEDIFKATVTPGILFEAFGFEYVGPLQGHDIHRMVETFEDVARLENPVLVHVVTTKGRGYAPAEANPSAYHGIGPYVIETGTLKPKAPTPPSYTSVFAETMVKLADQDPKIVGISAAMFEGTGLENLAQKYPERSFDVGIAEGHGVTFAAGLAREGFKPVAAIYSTFLQRGYDQIVHDVALQNLPVVFALDRGGLVGDDGPTHHGVFDISYLRHIPRMIVMSPKDENELRHMLFSALQYNAPVAVRYPRGPGLGVPLDPEFKLLPVGQSEVLREGAHVVIAAIGNMVAPAVYAATLLADQGISAAVINARFVKPVDGDTLAAWAQKTGRLVTVEENALQGGFGSAVLEALADRGVTVPTRRMGIPDRFIEHGSQEILRKELGLTEEGIVRTVLDFLNPS